MKDWVLSHRNLHCPPSKTYCEAHSGRFSGLRIILLRSEIFLNFRTSLPLPIFCPFNELGFQIVDLAGFVPDYSGVAVPDSHGVPFSASSHLNTDLFLSLHITIFKRMSTFFGIFL